ncbi:MAG: glycine C-acetyltransferase [Actinomycetota bacterium]|jgi:dethiobiotin synthetase
MRPKRVVVIAGTGTEVGKTFVGAAVAKELVNQRRVVIARKPAQSFDADDVSTDAAMLGAATSEDPEAVCPPHRWYPVPMAPPMAAAVLGRDPFTTGDLAREVFASWADNDTQAEFGFVETAGGAWSPQASDGKHVGDFSDELDADAVLLVADAGLGVINAVRGATAAFGTARPLVVMLNRFAEDDALHVANRDWLVQNDQFTVAVDAIEAVAALLTI